MPGEPFDAPIALRSILRPGDIGRITALHGVLYAAEYGWNHSFEAYVGEYLSKFARVYGGTRECIWIAERDALTDDINAPATLVGCVAIAEVSQDVAQLRWFIVAPEARGAGLGRKLLSNAVDFCRSANYKRVILDTVSDLTAAAHLYHDAGFRLATEKSSAGWGSEVTEQRYELEL